MKMPSQSESEIEGRFLKMWRDFAAELGEWKPNGGPSDGLYVHPDDRDHLDKLSNEWRRFGSFKEYCQNYDCREETDKRVHLSLVPVPFVGDLRRADTVILANNWGFEDCDYYAQEQSGLWAALVCNLKQDLNNEEFPFFCLDPKFCWHPGFRYWEPRLRKILNAWRGQCTYLEALKELSKRIAVVQRVAYISRNAPSERLLRAQTSKGVLGYVRDVLAPQARKGERLLVVLRACWKDVAGRGQGISLPPNSKWRVNGHPSENQVKDVVSWLRKNRNGREM